MRLLWLNLFRKPLRTGLTIFGVAMALFLFCFIEAVLAAFMAGVAMSDASRLIVQHKESLGFLIPISYQPLIQGVDGVKSASGAVWFGGLSQEEIAGGEIREEFFPQFAMDLEAYLPIYPEIKIPPEDLKELMADRMGCVLGDNIAARLNKKVGDKITIRSTLWNTPDSALWDFNIRAIYTSDSPKFDKTMMLFHYKYLDEARQFAKGTVGLFIIGIDDPNRYEEIGRQIDERFANSPFETRTMTESAFNMQFVSMMGNFQVLFRTIGFAVVLTMLLVSANTMMMSARERTREMGVLKSIGFTDGRIFFLLIGEALIIAGIGAAFGAGSAYLLFNVAEFNPKPDFFPVFLVPLLSLGSALVIAVITGVLSGLVPALNGARLKATEALRSV